ncbi:MAG: hydantoinase B/oxoprolinase family protein, partial [Candidatus Dadabacteria bacterium]|nr:hydantoinase B/oxoprolinase family protein [Candidatus Dadabacteria bacterium]NIQ15553.1 hydantoinase B/oxoprolinase family protein [Candidatus Dadabacteria bacterium]
HIPVHLGSMSFSTRAIVENKSIKIKEGDIFILNDPFKGGTHLPDITCISPVFIKNKLEFLLVSRAHHADIGGKTPGSMPLSNTIHDEGLIIPPTKICSNGKINKRIFNKIINSTRNPTEREGDFHAQIASLNIGKKRILELVKKYSIKTVKMASEELVNYSEKLMRSVIKTIPDGKYRFKDYLDDDGFGTKNIPIKVLIEISDDQAIIDFSGSSKKVEGCLNAPFSVTTSAVIYCFQCLAPKNTPLNSGPLRAINIKVENDSILNAKYPNAVVGGNVETSQRIVDAVFGALSKAIPNKVQAASNGSMNNITFGGKTDNINEYTYYETIGGGMGARSGLHGISGIQTHMTNTLNTPIEALERELPIMIEKYAINKNSGGKGKFKGGNGIIREYKFLNDSKVTILSERRVNEPWGIKGGENGSTGKNILFRNKSRSIIPAKCSFDAHTGDIVRIETAGGGAWGKSP